MQAHTGVQARLPHTAVWHLLRLPLGSGLPARHRMRGERHGLTALPCSWLLTAQGLREGLGTQDWRGSLGLWDPHPAGPPSALCGQEPFAHRLASARASMSTHALALACTRMCTSCWKAVAKPHRPPAPAATPGPEGKTLEDPPLGPPPRGPHGFQALPPRGVVLSAAQSRHRPGSPCFCGHGLQLMAWPSPRLALVGSLCDLSIPSVWGAARTRQGRWLRQTPPAPAGPRSRLGSALVHPTADQGPRQGGL